MCQTDDGGFPTQVHKGCWLAAAGLYNTYPLVRIGKGLGTLPASLNQVECAIQMHLIFRIKDLSIFNL